MSKETKATRHAFDQSNKKLIRARRLYAHLVSKSIAAQPETAVALAFRAQEAGLYSRNISVNNICFSLIRHAHKHHGTDNWWQWCRDNNIWGIWHNCAKYYKRNGDELNVKRKPRVRIAA